MVTNVDARCKIVEVWLTRAEQQDAVLQQSLKGQYAQWRRKGYLVAVYCSGNGNLYNQTLDLLTANKQRNAGLAVQRDRQHQTVVKRRA